MANRRFLRGLRWMSLAVVCLAAPASAASFSRVRFVVVDAATQKPIDGWVVVSDGLHGPKTMRARNAVLNLRAWSIERASAEAFVVKIPAGSTLQVQDTLPPQQISIIVTASRLQPKQHQEAASQTKDKATIDKFVNTTNGDMKALTRGDAGVAEDSAGQQHIRGEHTDITYVVDGVPLPDTLSGRQGLVVVPSTIQNLEVITGGFAPEFGGQTAAVLNIETLPNVKKRSNDLDLQGGGYDTLNGEWTAMGPLGKRASYVLNFGATQTANVEEPQQPDNQTAHNFGSGQSFFGKLQFAPSDHDSLSLTVGYNPNAMEIGNRTGLPASFADVGQGFGFQGFRNADGTRPDVTPGNAGLLGAAPMLLPSQQTAGMNIDDKEMNEFATFAWRRNMGGGSSAHLATTILHSGQDVTNANPAVDLLSLPVDNSIEYNPTVSRNVHHVQLVGDYSSKPAQHALKAGFQIDEQSGRESYQITPASRLALDALAALYPRLVPAGTTTGATDIDGNPVFAPNSGVSPTLKVSRSGYYAGAYLQDTWHLTKKLTVNYGLRSDWYRQSQNLGQATVDRFELSPRVNFSWEIDQRTRMRWSYDHLLNTPPLAQGAIVGLAIKPETLDQYDIGIERRLAPGHTASVAYYYKEIQNQVDVGLLVPGSEIGLYSGVNFQQGGVHGLELSYDIAAPKGIGWDGYLNYTFSAAKPNGLDNTGAPAPEFNDHDQRQTLGLGAAYTWQSGASAALTFQYGSGLASSVVPPSNNRTPRSQTDLLFSTGDKLFRGRGGLGLSVQNLFDDRSVINFQSGFSGTRFVQGRRVLLSASWKF